MTVFDAENKTASASILSFRKPLLAFSLLVFLIGAAGYTIFDQYKRSITEQEIQNLGAIADLKVAQIVLWRDNHRRRAEFFSFGALLPDEVDKWLREGAPENSRKQKILRTLRGIQSEQGCLAVILLGRDGSVRITTNGNDAADAAGIKLAMEAMSSQRVLFSELHRLGSQDKEIVIDSAAPLRVMDKKRGSRLVGAILLQTDPGQYLYPMLQSWPTRSSSAETLLVMRDGDDMVFLNELRHQKGTSLSLRFPLTNAQLPSVRAVLGHATDVTEGIDYRGIPVVAAMRSIPQTSWIMVSKVDKDELFAPIYHLKKWIAGLGLVFVAFAAGLFFLWNRGARARYQQLRAQRDTALERERLLKHFEYLTRYANDIIIVADDTGQIVEANERAQQALGYSRGELLQKHIAEVQGLLDIFRHKGESRVEGIYQRKEGSAFPVEISARRIYMQGTFYLQCIARDITERKLTEEALIKNQALLNKSQQMARIGSWELDLDTKVLSWSDETFRIFQVDPACFGATYEAFLEMVHPDDRDVLNKTYLDSVNNRTPYEIVHRFILPDQCVKFVHEWCETQYDDEGHPIRSIGTMQDVTERKAAEELIKRSEAALAEFKYTLDQTLDCVFIFQPDTLRFTYVNEGAKAQVGFSEAELLQMTPLDIKPVMPEADFRSMLQTLLDGNLAAIRFETMHRHRDGRDIPVEINLQLVQKAGQESRFVAIVRDITERKLFEAEFIGAKEQAEQANRAKSEFLSRMSHELRTPLNSIIGFAQVMETSAADETMGAHLDHVKTIIRSGWHLLRIIEDLLNLSAIEAGKIELNTENVDMRGCLKECFELMEPLASQKMIEFRCVCTELEGVMVRADIFRLKQVVINLLANAIKFNKVGGSVTVRGQRTAGYIRILISDTGEGILEDDLPSIFQPFSRLSKRPFSIEGAGIGLSIAKQLVELMGGRIGVESILYLGSNFWIELPATDGEATLRIPPDLLEQSVRTDNQAVLLYIEDNPDHVTLAGEIISRIDNLTMLSAHTPALGLDIARARRPDIILLDICLPGMNGYEILNLLQNGELTRNIPVIAISAAANPAEIKKGMRAGFRGYLTKPLNIVEFRNTIMELLRDKSKA